MSSPNSRSPQSTPKRTPLQEHTASQTNEASARLQRHGKQDAETKNIFATSPFPTKASHVLLPSTLKKKRSAQNVIADIFTAQDGPSNQPAIQTAPAGGRRPALKLKRSVKTLRDVYEAHTDDSRPSTAMSGGQRPGSSSSRLRSASSSDGLSGRFAWEHFKKLAPEDTAALPPLPEAAATLRAIDSKSSFASRAAVGRGRASSSPNYKLFDATSSSRVPPYADLSDLSSDPLDTYSSSQERSSSSANLVRLGGSSSNDELRGAQESSPNLVTLGTSSPVQYPGSPTRRMSVEELSIVEEYPDSPYTRGEISPGNNVMRLHGGPQGTELESEEGSSSPNFVKLGTSSPLRGFAGTGVSQGDDGLPTRGSRFLGNDAPGTPSPTRTIVGNQPSLLPRSQSTSSTESRKRKLKEMQVGPSFATRIAVGHQSPSSFPSDAETSEEDYAFRSSPPEPETQSKSIIGSPVEERGHRRQYFDPGSNSLDLGASHEQLQAALSSSPAPPIQYPVIRAPPAAQYIGLAIPKRQGRSSEVQPAKWPSRLSAGSEGPASRSKNSSKRSSTWEDTESDTESIAPPPHAYRMDSTNNSQIRIIPDTDSDEADDEISALPGRRRRYRSPPVVPARGASYSGTAAVSQTRLDTLQNAIDSRLSSMRSMSFSRPESFRSLRPESSRSSTGTVVVPTWAQRYYSGMYHDSFRFLAASASNVSLNQVPPPPPPKVFRAGSVAATDSSRSTRLTSLKDSIVEHIPQLFRSKNRPRLTSQKSHLTPGIGPLVSNPIREPATAAMSSQSRIWHFAHGGIRAVSLPVDPADPRAHWAGFSEQLGSVPEAAVINPTTGSVHHHHMDGSGSNERRGSGYDTYYTRRTRLSRIPSISPHLHHDHRLNTGSSASRGFGHPYNRRSRFSAPSLYSDPGVSSSKIRKARNVQVLCFMLGFPVPLAWIVASFLPLPQRPDSMIDIEKSELRRSGDLESEALDLLSRLRREKTINGSEEMYWQNARWWRNVNRSMSAIGIIVIVVVVVLAVIGTRNW